MLRPGRACSGGHKRFAGLSRTGLLCWRRVESILAKALGQEKAPASAAEKRDLFERLLARLAHEIRNPLSSLDIHVQLLEEDLGVVAPQLRTQLTSRLEIIHGELHRLESIVDHFLRLAGPSALDLEPVELPKVVSHVCELLRPEAAARGIEIVVAVPEGLLRFQADPVRLAQAVMNLVINGIQAVQQKGRIEVNASQAGEEILLSVRDDGPGIPGDKIGSIFEPYFTTKAEGNGLGLWIAQQIVTAHGGTLQAQNAPERGAIFTMVLPLKRA